jgi:hypothetical protein
MYALRRDGSKIGTAHLIHDICIPLNNFHAYYKHISTPTDAHLSANLRVVS